MEESEILLNISDNMFKLMEKKNLNRRQLAKKARCSFEVISRVKYGTNSTTIFNYINIANALGVTLDELITYSINE